VSRRDPKGLGGAVLRSVVGADAAKLPAYVGVPLPEGYLLVRIAKVIEADPKEQAKDSTARASALLGASQYEAYVESLRKQADISINQAALQAK
jgi:peptidyl-prolyl cis-trans isomerase D